MEGLGRLFDIGTAIAPVDLNTADSAIGKRVALRDASGVTILLSGAVGPATDVTVTVQQHTAASGGTTATLATVDHYYVKHEATLDNDESWLRVESGISGGVITLAAATYGAVEKLVALEINAKTLGTGIGTPSAVDTFTHVSVNVAGALAAAQLISAVYILHGLKVERAPELLGNLLSPGVADV